MKPDAKILLARLEAYSPDDPASAFPFSAKLAKENGWSGDHARRVVAEYKRFAFLAMTADHVAAPSDQVDQAWHLHITYTRSYWEEFCGKVLGKPLHHEPSKGGRPEDHKYRELYVRTLKSYRDAFDEEPPADIWPPVGVRFGEDTRFVRINRARNWIVPKPRWVGAAVRALPVAVGATALIGCSSAAMVAVFPFDLRGADFLGFFGLFALVVFGLAFVVRNRLRRPHRLPADLDLDAVDACEVAMLAGGSARVAGTLLAPLYRQGCIEVAAGKVTATDEPGPNSRPAEIALWRTLQTDGPESVRMAELSALSILRPLEADLEAKGLLMNPADSLRARLIPLTIALLVPLVGGIKATVGLSRGKPIGFLVMGTLVSLVLSVVISMRKGRRSRAGDELLSRLRQQHADLETPSPRLNKFHSQADFALPMAVALFGTGAMSNAGLFPLENLLTHRAGSSDSGCGGSSCGGGGGGCGGGGCGGCGGD
jgi:uncharacterized protein (TIGR04222 family)